MKKIGIMTLNGYFNYGNRLQNYALQEFIKKSGYDNETIVYNSSISSENVYHRVLNRIKSGTFFETAFNKFRNRNRIKEEHAELEIRESKFKKFSQQYLNETSEKYNTEMLLTNKECQHALNERYQTFFVGSDQVWSLEGDKFPESYFLPFVDKRKRNSFAASFGFSKIPDTRMNDYYRQALSQMNNISVREETGKIIVNQLFKKEVEVLLDPTFLLTKSDWKKITNDSILKPNGKYMVTYFLGKKTEKYQKLIDRISKKYNLQVVYLNDINYKEFYTASPDEFIDIFSDASFVITDSFHGTVFSTIFEVPFFAVDRVDQWVNMSTRLVNILEKFDLMDRYLKNIEDIKLESINLVNFEKARRVIEINIKKSQVYLKKCILSAEKGMDSE